MNVTMNEVYGDEIAFLGIEILSKIVSNEQQYEREYKITGEKSSPNHNLSRNSGHRKIGEV